MEAAAMNVHENGSLKSLCTASTDPLNWGLVAEGLKGSHLEEVKRMKDLTNSLNWGLVQS
ncbi:hypothetical protein Pint_35646 [Pistacia integerrima]|uniref:Uncharacterized protein n=1 Tax=Pistacia integerrima TaxID=434235 RepID=A0ACC0XZV0_9ROSI|nr:hypothetical protein Pint_35646 [Pistacia integerrima]